jgi:hypothetical protein
MRIAKDKVFAWAVVTIGYALPALSWNLHFTSLNTPISKLGLALVAPGAIVSWALKFLGSSPLLVAMHLVIAVCFNLFSIRLFGDPFPRNSSQRRQAKPL